MMRFLFVIFGLCLLLNCNSRPNTVNTPNTLEKSKKQTDTNQIKNTKVNVDYPILNDTNALDFFINYGKVNKENKVRLTTDFGIIDIELYNETKYHRANFIYLTKRNYFDGTQFYRVVKNFVIQGGSSDDYNIAKRRRKIGKYLLPPDTKRGFTHKRGAVSMPSSEIENAYKLASPFQFFIINRKGGAKYLDKDYTVFGEVISGMDIVDKINAVETDKGDWPLQNVYIRKVEIISVDQ